MGEAIQLFSLSPERGQESLKKNVELRRSAPAPPSPGDSKGIHSFIQHGFIVVFIWPSSKQSQPKAGKGPEAPTVERRLPGKPGQRTGRANTTPGLECYRLRLTFQLCYLCAIPLGQSFCLDVSPLL